MLSWELGFGVVGDWLTCFKKPKSGNVKAVIFAKQSERLPGKHMMDICGQPMIKRIYDTLLRTGFFDDVLIYSKYADLKISGCKIERDGTQGTLIDSLLSAISAFHEFLAVGGDLPLLDGKTISIIVRNYHNDPVVSVDSDGTVEPLLAIYNDSIYDDLLSYSRSSKKIYEFVGKRFRRIVLDSELSSKLFNVNTMEDLKMARKLAGCREV